MLYHGLSSRALEDECPSRRGLGLEDRVEQTENHHQAERQRDQHDYSDKAQHGLSPSGGSAATTSRQGRRSGWACLAGSGADYKRAMRDFSQLLDAIVYTRSRTAKL